MAIKKILLIIFCFSISGCGYVEITSNPSGAKIEINNDYIGNTPLSYRWDSSYKSSSTYVIKAYPISAGQQVQTKYIQMNKLPRNIYFDMNLITVPKQYEIDLD